MEQLRAELAGVPMVSFTLDGWTSPTGTSFLAVTAHWVDQHWNLQDVTLGFERLIGSHNAKVLLQAFVNVVERFGLQRKIMAITTDNGSNVLKMVKDLEKYTKKHPELW